MANLTAPRPRILPQPEMVDPLTRPPRPPEEPPTEALDAIDAFVRGFNDSTLPKAIREKNREMEAERHRAAKAPDLATLKRPSNFKAIKENLEKAEQEEMAQFRMKPLGKRPKEPVEYKTNTAAILREEAVWKKRQMEETKELELKEMVLRDANDFHAWKKSMQERDDAERAAEVERRKKESIQTDANAREAKRKQQQANTKLAQKTREQQQALLGAAGEEVRLKQMEKARQAKQTQAALREGVQKSTHQLQNERHRKANEVKRETDENEVKIAQMNEIERKHRQDAIAKIRALERNRSNGGVYTAKFDPNKAHERGMLNEMSLEQLKARLTEMENEEKERLRKMREKIAAEKTTKESTVAKKQAFIERQRARQRKTHNQNRQGQIERAEREKVVAEEREGEEMLRLQQKLKDKRDNLTSAQDELRKAEKERKIRVQLLRADKAAIEFHKWEEMENGISNAMKKEQERSFQAQKAAQTVECLNKMERANAMAQRKHKSIEKRREADGKLLLAKQADLEQSQVEAQLLVNTVASEKERRRAMQAARMGPMCDSGKSAALMGRHRVVKSA